MQRCVIFAALTAVAASYSSPSTKLERGRSILSSQSDAHHEHAAPRRYNFVYGVSDPTANTLFGHQEFSDGKSIAGSYHIRLPDGRHQTVIYEDDGTGFMADVSYDSVARHPDFNLYFESTREPVTVSRLSTPSSELEPPPGGESSIQSTHSLSTSSPLTSTTPGMQDSVKAVFNLTKPYGAAIGLKSRESTHFPELKSATRNQRAPAANETRNNAVVAKGNVPRKITKETRLQMDNAGLAKLARSKGHETLEIKQKTNTKKTSDTTEKPVDNFADTIFREDFPTPTNEAINANALTEKPKVKTMQKQPLKRVTSEFKLANATKVIVKMTTVQAKRTSLSETSTLKSPNVTNGITKQLLTNASDKVTKVPPFKPVTTPKPPTTPMKTEEPPNWKPIKNVANGASFKQVVAKTSDLNVANPTFASTAKRPLTIFELLDKFKPLSFRAPSKLTQRTIVKRSNPQELSLQTITEDLLKKFIK